MKQENQLELVNCNLCGSDDFTIIYRPKLSAEKDKDLAVKFRASGDERLIDQLVKCRSCGLVYINPRLKSELIVKGYADGSDENFVSQAAAREKTFTASLKNIEATAGKGKILDIGTAGGTFLAAAKKRGWDVYGCEPNSWMADWGRKHYGIDIKKGTLFDQKYKTGFFDVVTLWDVIEHTPDPAKVLEECNRILRPGGHLVINYPDYGSWISRLMGKRWVFLLSVHLFYFTPRTITKMLNKEGFRILQIKPHYQKLELGYLLFRMQAYSKFLASIGKVFVGALRMNSRHIPYWLGQTFVMARKEGRA